MGGLEGVSQRFAQFGTFFWGFVVRKVSSRRLILWAGEWRERTPELQSPFCRRAYRNRAAHGIGAPRATQWAFGLFKSRSAPPPGGRMLRSACSSPRIFCALKCPKSADDPGSGI